MTTKGYRTLPVQLRDSRREEFLAQFPALERSTITNMFQFAVRAGAETREAICAAVSGAINEKVADARKYGFEEERWDKTRQAVFGNNRLTWAYADYILDRENGKIARYIAEPEHDSHLEDTFRAAWTEFTEQPDVRALPLDLSAQHQVGIYRIDFALVALRIAVELDGHDWHSSPEQRAHDAAKARYLTILGWLVFRFTGHEVSNHRAECCEELYRLCVRRGAFDLPYTAIVRKS